MDNIKKEFTDVEIEQLIEKWSFTGLLKDVNEPQLTNICVGFELTANLLTSILMHEDYDLRLDTIVFPTIRRIFGEIDYEIPHEEIFNHVLNIIKKLDKAATIFYCKYDEVSGFPIINGVDVEAQFLADFSENYKL